MRYLLLFWSILLFSSCKEKLPNNILTQKIQVEKYLEILDKSSVLILNTDKQKIDLLSEDSLISILSHFESWSDGYKSSKKELDELLKFNPQFSDYDEIKSMKEPQIYINTDKIYKNKRYMNERYRYLNSKKYNLKVEEPIY